MVNGQESIHKGYQGTVSIILAIGWFSFTLGREAIPPLLPTIISDLSISQSKAGVALSLMWGIYAIIQFPGGRVSDVNSRKLVIVPSLLTAICGLVALALVDTFIGFLISVCFLGAGGGAFYASNRGLITDEFTSRRGEAVGLQIGAGAVGSALASGSVVIASLLGSWQSSFLIPGVLLFLISVISHTTIEGDYSRIIPSLGIQATLSRVLGSSRMKLFLIVYSVYAFVWQGVMTFLPTFLQVEKDLSPSLAGGIFASMYIAGIIAGPTAGSMGDRFGYFIVATFALMLGVAGLIGVIILSSLHKVIVTIIIFAIGVRAFPPVMQTLVLNTFNEDTIAGDFGAFKSLYTGIGSLGPLTVGIMSDLYGYNFSFILLMTALVFSIAFMILINLKIK